MTACLKRLRWNLHAAEVISLWASLGREAWRAKKPNKKFEPLDLGEEKLDLSSRKDWMDALDDRS